MTDYYRVDDSGSIFLIRESRIISETPRTITIKSDYANHRHKKENLLTDFTKAKNKADSIIKAKIKSLQKQIDLQQEILTMLNKLDDEQLRSHHYESFIAKDW